MIKASDLQVSRFVPLGFPRTLQLLEKGVEEGVFPGAVAGFWLAHDSRSIFLHSIGSRRVHPAPQVMELDTTFDLASVSKVFGTATLAARVVERGLVSWTTPLKSVIPGFRHSGIHLGHVLSHTAGFPAWVPYWEKMRAHFAPKNLTEVSFARRQEKMREFVLETNPEVQPGKRALYSDVCFLLAGFALEEVTGLSLDRAVQEYVWNPLGVDGAFYRRTTKKNIHDESCAATELAEWRGGYLQGQVHDENCWTMGGVAGHAGTFGRARDVLHFAKGLLEGFLSAEIRNQAWSRVQEPQECERTWGWDTPSGETSAAGKYFGPRTVGHLGFTGTSLWIDPDAGLAVTLLTNRVHPTRENQKIREFRPQFHNALWEDLKSSKILR